MAREFPIHNGRMTTDLDANGHRIKNLPPGSGFTQVQSDWGQPVATAPDYIKNKPTIPAPVTIDPSLSPTSENPVQNKVVTNALYTGFTEWEFSDVPQGFSVERVWYETQTPYGARWAVSYNDVPFITVSDQTSRDATELTFEVYGGSSFNGMTATRHLITPTKTSQLTNDGPSSGPNVGHPFATTNQIPAPVDISGKLDGEAAYPAWEPDRVYQVGEVVSYKGRIWKCISGASNIPPDDEMGRFIWGDSPVTIGVLKQDTLSPAQLAAANSGATEAKVATWDEYAAQIAAKANAADVATALAQKASLTDLPYAMVTPGEWEFSDGGSHTVNGPYEDPDGWYYLDGVSYYNSQFFDTEINALAALSLAFTDGSSTLFTATRASLPGHLLDRAGNRVVVSGDTTLTLPAAIPGYLRDFLVRLEISGSTVPTITFQGQGSEAPNGADEIIYETDGDEFPVPDEAGTWSYSFTENCVAHKFAVSLKKVNEVAQGGS